jgi:hypothetical protein
MSMDVQMVRLADVHRVVGTVVTATARLTVMQMGRLAGAPGELAAAARATVDNGTHLGVKALIGAATFGLDACPGYRRLLAQWGLAPQR